MKEKLEKIYKSLKDDFSKKNYFKLMLKGFFYAVIWLILILLLITMGIEIQNFIITNWDFLFLAGGGTFIVCYSIKEHYDNKQKEIEKLELQEKLLQEEADNTIIERNYRLLRTTLFEVTSYIHDVIHVKKPTIETELDTPNHTVRKLNFIIYQYILYPLNTSDVDTEIMKRVMQQEYARRLDTQSFSGISQSYYFYEGQAEPIISVYEISHNGAYVTVSLVITDENYCRHIRHGLSANLLYQAEQIRNLNDKDF